MFKKEFLSLTKVFWKPLVGFFLGILCTLVFLQGSRKNKYVQSDSVIGKPVFEVDGKIWTSSELPYEALAEFANLEESIHSAEKNFAERMGVRFALAKDLGKKVTLDHLPKLEELLTISSAKESDAKKYYEDLVQRMGPGVFAGQNFEKIKAQLIQQISQQRLSEASQKKIVEFRENGRVRVLFIPPAGPPAKFQIDSFPTRGNQNAQLTFVAVSDYLNSKSKEEFKEINKLYKNFSSKIKFVNISYSLNQSSFGLALSRGAYCAFEQGNTQFWNYHNHAFNLDLKKIDDKTLSYADHDLKTIDIAKNAKVDITKFRNCLASKKSQDYLNNVRSQLIYSTALNEKGQQMYLNRRPVRVSLSELDSTLINYLR